MAFNGSGVFVRLYNWVADRNAAIKIRADRMDAEMDGMATGLSNCITKDGQTTVTANIPFNNKRLTGVADATADTDAVNRQTADARYGQSVGLAASVGSSALTISLKTIGGNDPSAADPVVIPFRSATSATGTLTRRTLTAATSLVISSGSTMGFANATAGRIWIVAFDDAGTVRLGAINCRDGVNIFRLGQIGIASSTEEGGVGAADSAHVFYTGTAVSSKAYTVLGFMEWSAGLTTAGTWAIVPTGIVIYQAGSKLPGDVIQSRAASNSTYSSTTTVLPIDGTVPQITEGSQISSISLTPGSAANIVEIETGGILGSSAAGSAAGVAIFRSDSTNALVAHAATYQSANSILVVHSKTSAVLNTTAAITISNRHGPGGAWSSIINGGSASAFGAASSFDLSCREIVA